MIISKQIIMVLVRKNNMSRRISRVGRSTFLKVGVAISLMIVLLVSVPKSMMQIKRSSQNSSSKKRRLEFVHITKTGGSAVEKVGAQKGIIWGACHYMNITEVGCANADLEYIAPNYQSYVKTSPWHTPPKILKTQYSSKQNPYTEADLFAVVRNPYDRVLSEYYCPWTGFQPKFRKNTKHEKDPNDPKIMNYWVKNMVTKLEKSLNDYMKIKPENRPKEQGKGVNEDPYDLAQKHYVNQAEYVFDDKEQVVKNLIYYEDLSTEFEKLMKEYGLNLKLPPKNVSGTYTNTEKKLTYLDLDEESIAVINRYAKKDFEMLGYQMVSKFDPKVEYSLKSKHKK